MTMSTLCWYCEKAYGSCAWSRKDNPRPVDGWQAIRNDLAANGERAAAVESYVVLHCPEFSLDPRFKQDYQSHSKNDMVAFLQMRLMKREANQKHVYPPKEIP